MAQWFFASFFQCSLICHTALLPADISQKPFFTLWIQHSLCDLLVFRDVHLQFNNVVQYSKSSLIFCCTLYWFNLSHRKARDRAILMQAGVLFFFFLFYSPNRIPVKLHFWTKKERNMYFVEWMVKSLAKIWNLEPGVTIPLRLQQKNLNSVCNTIIHIPTIYDQETISSELCMKRPTVLSPSWGNVQGIT